MNRQAVVAYLDKLVTTPAYHDVLAILKGARNGFVYGARVRGPHALVMSLIFQSGSLRQRLAYVYRATKQHSLNLARFVAIYKTALLVQKSLAGGKQRKFDTFFAGLVGGWAVFGERNAVNEQIVLYVVSRVITSFLPRATPPVPSSASSASAPAAVSAPDGFPRPPGYPYPKSRAPHPKVFELYSALAWGMVMYLFRENRDRLHGGMVSSMQYLYLDSEVWNSFKTLLWPNSLAAMYASRKKVAAGNSDVRAMLSPDALGTADQENAASGSGNALAEVTLPRPDLRDLATLHPETVSKSAIGTPRAYPDDALQALKTLSLPKSLQKLHAMTSKPASVVRESTVELARVLDQARTESSESSRFILAGPEGSGKTTLLVQAASYAHSNGWVVLYLPSATATVDSSSAFTYSSERALFEQPGLAADLLQRFSSANKAAFKSLKTSRARVFGEKEIASGKSLEELAKAGMNDDKLTTAVFEAVMEELAEQKERPVLLAIDHAQSLFSLSAYTDPSYERLHPYHLVIPRMLLDFTAGQLKFAQGAVVLAPSSRYLASSPPLSDFLSANSPNLGSDPLTSVYERADVPDYSTYASILNSGVKPFLLPDRLNRKEAMGIVDLVKGWRGAREAVDDASFLERLVATDGNPRLFMRALSKNVAV
ncbi:peroxisomal protein [Rhodotorula sp. JG-1b]|nr:peroxisomal protein [Rhodotorula sp. JG-1b]